MINIFGKKGNLGNIHDRFEFRHEQLHMAEFVLELLVDNQCGIVEAGTGVGKTLAYLVPAIIYCVENDKTLAISTETKALQKQLTDKDLPIVKALLDERGIKFKHSICMGSSNYACIRRFNILVTRGGFSGKELKHIETLSGFIDSRKVFSRFDVSLPDHIWNSISREPDSCGNYKCPHFNSCFFQQAKKEWADSDLLIMNHYLFFTNIAAQKTYLPLFDNVVFDEAHSLEEICANQMGFIVGENDLSGLIEDYFGSREKSALAAAINNDSLLNRTGEISKKVNLESAKYFESLRKSFSEKLSIRCNEPTGENAQPLIESLDSFLAVLGEISSKLQDENLTFEFDLFRSRIFQINENIKNFAYHGRESYVYWKEKQEGGLLGTLYLMGQPLDVSGILREEVNSFYDSVLYTSATLSINGNFDYVRDRLGIENCKELLLHSPFNFEKQAVLYVSRSEVEPNNPSYMEFLSSEINEIVESLNGNCLVLFTSYKTMGLVRQKLEIITGRNLHVQGDAPASVIMNNYINDSGSILMGTHSFWQGIDLAGELLKGVIITRLPFNVPDRPYIQARSETFSDRGLNPFYTYHVPEAILKFKQGFGRLIRSSSDRGVVAILDSRISKKNYGHLFISSIPSCKVVTSMTDLTSVIPELMEFDHD